ncbi:sugar phosphate isomerase/epimerase family protein [Paenibacillus sacheonensis]|uniref:TIM barrel protein n=1 Tax=Paenibacillus sacheonensis TaxID=742054 RepID=A0A7X5BXT5_9BACL|nr:TIM barrel protein [Paenibacillus sacheonensis]MBM7564394.1 sugar phosphate isomerase/epimerase [Paenibacillus sacheonensis]NBC68957.1 TIM barrel protein [Paenibacillus sacheonensis]
MKISICSFSFHRMLAAGQQDIFQYIQDCKQLGCTQLDPWNAHLAQLNDGADALHAGANPGQSQHLKAVDDEFLARVKLAADEAGLPFGCIAVDGAHIYEASEEARTSNRQRAYRWIAIAEQLGATSVRIDAGGPQQWSEEVFGIIVEGYKDVIEHARNAGIQVLVENHWGPTVLPDNTIRLLEAVPGLGLLLDSWNWAHGKQAEGWLKCAKYAAATHIKSFHFTEDGQELTQNVPAFCKLMLENGFQGTWGVESVPADGNEIEGARKTIQLIRQSVQ